AAFEAFLSSRQEPSWLTEQRREAWARFNEMPLPARAEEEWMRTDIRLFQLNKFGLPTEAATESAAPAALLSKGVELAGHATTVNNRPVSASLAEKYKKQGVLFGSLDDFLQDHSDLLRRNLFHAVDSTADKFASLHAACWSGGSLLYVPK